MSAAGLSLTKSSESGLLCVEIVCCGPRNLGIVSAVSNQMRIGRRDLQKHS
jgi:hypothetical protein